MEKKLIVLLSSLIFLFLPLYYLDSGELQPVDFFIFLLLCVFFLLRFPYLITYWRSSSTLKVFILFSVYMIMILLLSFIINAEMVSIRLAIQIGYALLLLLLFLMLFTYLENQYPLQTYYQYILNLLLIDLIIPLLFAYKGGIADNRVQLSFNNPNQLGFFAIINMGIFFYISLIAKKYDIQLKKILSLFIININFLLIYLSASRACYAAALLYVLSYPILFNIKLRGYTRQLIYSIGSLVLSGCIALIGYRFYLLTLHTRIHYINVSTDVYLRLFRGITNNLTSPWYFLFGTGSYNTVGRTLEFHNNFFAIFNMVGVCGLLFYIYMNILIIKDLFKRGIYYLVPYGCYLFYSMLHYSYRTRMNWLFLAMIFFILVYKKNQDDDDRKWVKDRA